MSTANERSLALAEVKADLMEQCRLLGEQELKHLAQIESLEHERDALRAELDALRVQRPFDAEEAPFRSAFEACIKDGQWPVKRKGEGYRSPMTQMAFEIAFCVVNKLKLYARHIPAQSVCGDREEHAMNEINNGGPRVTVEHGEYPMLCSGMTLRDYFAAKIDMTDVPISAFEALIGEFPSYASPKDKQDWHAKGEAAFRFHRADAMLKAREAKS